MRKFPLRKFLPFLLLIILLGNGCVSTPPVQPVSTRQQPAITESTDYPVNADAAVDSSPLKESVVKTDIKAADVQEKSAPVPVAPNGYYKNVNDDYIPRPYVVPSRFAGVSAQCRDGTYSFSQSRRGTCSHHGGVAERLKLNDIQIFREIFGTQKL